MFHGGPGEQKSIEVATTSPIGPAFTAFFTTNSLAGGGAQRSTLLIVLNWKSRVSKARLIVGSLEGPYAKDVPSTDSVVVVGAHDIFHLPLYLLRVRREIHARSRVVLFAFGHQAKVLLAARWARVLPNVPVIVVQRNDFASQIRSQRRSRTGRGFDRRISRMLYRRANAIVGVSKGVSRDLENALDLPAGSVTPIHNPVDVAAITQFIDSTISPPLQRVFDGLARPIIITTGRMVEQKAHSDLLEAFVRIRSDQRGSLVILGDGPLRGELEHHAQRLGIGDRVWMPGFVDNPWWFIARSDVFALSSHWEGHPRAILEALACDVPIVSTDCPSGPRELLAGAQGTCLTPVGDPIALSNAIEEFLTHPVRPDVELAQYRPQKIASQYEALAQSTLIPGTDTNRKRRRR